MNKKAFELAISTLIIVILAVVVLIAIIIAVRGGFSSFSETTEPFTDLVTATAVKQSCQNACETEVRLTYCCEKYEIDSEEIACNDSRLEVTCTLDCSQFSCE